MDNVTLIQDITLPYLWTKQTGAHYVEVANIRMFVNFNRFLKPFIRVNALPNVTATFPYSKKGLARAKAFALRHMDN